MTKLKNTMTNRLLVLGAFVGGGALLGRKLGREGDKTTLMLVGAVMGAIVYGGTNRFILEPKIKKA